MTSPYVTNRVSVYVADDLKGVLLQHSEQNITEKAPGTTVTMHAAEAALLKKSGMVEDVLAVANLVPDQAASSGAYSYTIPANTFSGGNQNVYTATKGDGSALPGWMSFDPTTRVISGTATAGTTAVKIIATSRGGQVAFDTFNIVIS